MLILTEFDGFVLYAMVDWLTESSNKSLTSDASNSVHTHCELYASYWEFTSDKFNALC